MIKSMTGFSRVQVDHALGELTIELKSVNSRFLDTHFRLSHTLKPFEAFIRQTLRYRLARGNITCTMQFSPASTDHFALDQAYVSALMVMAEDLASRYAIAKPSVGELLSIPGVLASKTLDEAALKALLIPQLEHGIDTLIEQRRSEGQHLQRLVDKRLTEVARIVDDLSECYQRSVESVRQKLYDKLDELAGRYRSDIDEVRFEQEMIYYLQKMDMAEEIERLTGHIGEVRKLLSSTVPIGRKLDFLMQEMHRESNTIGAKSQSLGITLNAIELKVLLEQIREQIQNIE